MNSLATAVALSDQDLLARVQALAGHEREATAELVAHLAALELRPSLHEAEGYGSLFAYCTEVLHLSEDAACNRIEAARACRSFPVILDLLASGSLTLTSVRKLRKHLTPENHEAVLARARHQKKEQIEALVAELAPVSTAPLLELVALGSGSNHYLRPTDEPSDSGAARDGDRAASPSASGPTMPPPAPRPVVQALSPGRYRVQFTIGQHACDKLRRVQTLLRREVPNGDTGVIFERFIDVLLHKVEKDKLGKRDKDKFEKGDNDRASATTQLRSDGADPSGAYENRIRSGTDPTSSRDVSRKREDCRRTSIGLEQRKTPSRHIPNAVKRAVWFRDRARCAFVAGTGHRCTERSFLELHHIRPYALDGPATVGNISLRCRRHNQYEAELVFGARNAVKPDRNG